MSKKSGKIVKHTVAELRAMEKRGEIKTDWKAAAKTPCPQAAIPTTRWKRSMS
jgi:hypothetical protein